MPQTRFREAQQCYAEIKLSDRMFQVMQLILTNQCALIKCSIAVLLWNLVMTSAPDNVNGILENCAKIIKQTLNKTVLGQCIKAFWRIIEVSHFAGTLGSLKSNKHFSIIFCLKKHFVYFKAWQQTYLFHIYLENIGFIPKTYFNIVHWW